MEKKKIKATAKAKEQASRKFKGLIFAIMFPLILKKMVAQNKQTRIHLKKVGQSRNIPA